ncbi:MAG: hypothetical protein ACTSYC_12615 [Promethearchaeota archaeon]
MVRLFPKKQILAHKDKIEKWTEIEISEKRIEVFVEKTPKTSSSTAKSRKCSNGVGLTCS